MTTGAMERLLTPEQREQRRQIEEKRKLKARVIDDSLKRAFATPDGKIALRWLAERSSFLRSKVSASKTTGEIIPLNTVYDSARENLYLELRDKCDENVVSEIEKKSYSLDKILDMI